MDHLLQLANEFGLQEIVTRAIESRDVQGVVVSVHPLWLLGQDLERRGADIFDWRFAFRHGLLPRGQHWPDLAESIVFPATHSDDLKERSPLWREIYSDSIPPLLVHVCFRPGANMEALEFAQTTLLVQKEIRPLARISGPSRQRHRPVIGGISIGDSAHVGTLGGVLTGPGGKLYGMTCAHVLGARQRAYQPSQRDGPSRHPIGSVVAAERPAVTAAACNPYHGGPPRQIDAAIIEISDAKAQRIVLDIGRVDGVTPKRKLSTGVQVEVSGRTSGYRRLTVGGIAATYRFSDDNGNFYCYENLFEVRWPSFTRLLLSRPVQGGDSGAWVLVEGESGTEWCGMIVGDDRVQGYATLSEELTMWLTARGFTLSV